MTSVASKYNASASMLGYLYQCREALLLAIEETKSHPNLSVSIERFDDVAFDEDGTPVALIQLKHRGSVGNLADTSVDLWKTLRIWCEQVKDDPQLPFSRRFLIVTTGTAPVDSVAEKLRFPRAKADHEAEALAQLKTAALTSTNQQTKEGREAFLALSELDQKNLIAAVHIHDQAPTITNARSEIEDKLEFSVPAGYVAALVDHLEGWWFSQIVHSLAVSEAPSISLLSLRQKIDEIASAFRTKELLLDDSIPSEPDAADLPSDARTFVKQMRCVGLPEPAVDFAKRDYYRATAQRSAWARENVLLDGETQRYDTGLVDRWQRKKLAQDETHPVSTDEEKRLYGRSLFHWANQTEVAFRNRHEQWLCSGSFQILADRLAVGWHPEHQAMFGDDAESEAA